MKSFSVVFMTCRRCQESGTVSSDDVRGFAICEAFSLQPADA